MRQEFRKKNGKKVDWIIFWLRALFNLVGCAHFLQFAF